MLSKKLKPIQPIKAYLADGATLEDLDTLKYYDIKAMTQFKSSTRNILPEMATYIKQIQKTAETLENQYNYTGSRPDINSISRIYKKLFRDFPLIKERGNVSLDNVNVTQYINIDVYKVQVLKITTTFPINGERNLTVLFRYKNAYLQNEMLFKDIPDGINPGDHILLFGNWYLTSNNNLAFSCLGIAKCSSYTENAILSEYTGISIVSKPQFLELDAFQRFLKTDICRLPTYRLALKEPYWGSKLGYDEIFERYPDLSKIKNYETYNITLSDIIGDDYVNKTI